MGVENEQTRGKDIVDSLEYAANNDHQNAKIEIDQIKKKFKKGQYASLIQRYFFKKNFQIKNFSYTIAKREIVEEIGDMNFYSSKARNLQRQTTLPLELPSYNRISSDPKFWYFFDAWS